MRRRFTLLGLAAVLSLAAGLSFAPPARAAEPQPDMPGSTDKDLPSAPEKLPKPPQGDRAHNIDFLFEALKVAPDEETARQVENRIWALWLASGSPTTDLLMSRVKQAIEAKDTDLAIQLLSSIIEIKPDYVEAWNRRATIFFTRKEYGRAVADLREVLVREPRHFGALSGLGMIFQEMGDDKQALEVYRKALEIDPHLQKIPEAVKTLTEKVEGRDI